MKNILIALLVTSLFMAGAIDSAQAEKLCLKVSFNKKTGKVTTRSTFSATCPRGYNELADSASFVGSAGAAGATGATGAIGASGATGMQGATGATGASAFSTIPSGTTVRGVIGGGGNSNTITFVTQSLQAPTSQPIKLHDVIIAHTQKLLTYCSTAYVGGSIANCLSGQELAKDHTKCTGTFDAPTAPAGKVCIYIDELYAGYDLEAESAAASVTEGSLYGFVMQWHTEGNYSKVKASWAYTAP